MQRVDGGVARKGRHAGGEPADGLGELSLVIGHAAGAYAIGLIGLGRQDGGAGLTLGRTPCNI